MQLGMRECIIFLFQHSSLCMQCLEDYTTRGIHINELDPEPRACHCEKRCNSADIFPRLLRNLVRFSFERLKFLATHSLYGL